jgi:SM-20-related protein
VVRGGLANGVQIQRCLARPAFGKYAPAEKPFVWNGAALRFTLHPSIDTAALARTYESARRISISPFIADDQAETLREHLLQRDDWWRRLHHPEGKVFELSPQQVAGWGRQKIDAIRALIAPRAGQDGHGYTQSFLRIVDAKREERWETSTILGEFAAFLASDAMELVKTITGNAGINDADVFAARYDPGDYATIHNDGSGIRKAAFTFGLTKPWRPEWGGVLLFHCDNGQIEAGWPPAFNAFNLFKVPTQHSVSVIAPFAPEPRLAITGWFVQLDATPSP